MRARKLQRWVTRIHRYTGVAMCGMFAVWFLSGAVMSVSGFPRVTESERLEATLPLTGLDTIKAPGELSGLWSGQVRLEMLQGRPVYLGQRDGGPGAVWAETGESVGPFAARDAGALFGSSARVLATSREPDQWTAWYTGQAGLHRVALGDESGTEVYISAATGQRVQQTTRFERGMAWVGAIPHWVYLTALRKNRGTWRWFVIVLSGVACLVCVTGLWNGLRLMRRRSGCLRLSPIKDRELRTHHLLGLGFGLLCLSWTLSGFFSMSPFAWNRSGFPSAAQRQLFQAGGLDLKRLTVSPRAALHHCNQHMTTRSLRLNRVAGVTYYVCVQDSATSCVVDAHRPASHCLKRIPNAVIEAATAAVLGPGPVAGGYANRPDAYHYPYHGSPGLRVPFYRANAGDQTAYVDVHRGRLLKVHSTASRWTRWLYHGLHSWDLAPLYSRLGLWRAAIVFAMLTGFALSVSAIRLSLRLTRRRGARRRR